MKKIIILAALITSGLVYGNQANAQVRVNVNVNIGSQPVWGPVGYDYAEYYYMPDIDAYYYVPNRQFIYLEGNNWRFGASLPARYGNYDLYRGYKVVINEPRPYLHADVYRSRYARYRGWNGRQTIIRDSRDTRYYVIKDHPMHGKGNWKKYDGDNWGNGRGNGRGNGNGHGHGHH